jgi:hypothetical protein
MPRFETRKLHQGCLSETDTVCECLSLALDRPGIGTGPRQTSGRQFAVSNHESMKTGTHILTGTGGFAMKWKR